MADKPFNPLDPEQRAAANAANAAKNYKQFQEDAVAVAAATKPTTVQMNAGTTGIMKGYWNSLVDTVKAEVPKVEEVVKHPVDTYNSVKADVNKAIDDAAIKPGGGSTSWDRYQRQNADPGIKR